MLNISKTGAGCVCFCSGDSSNSYIRQYLFKVCFCFMCINVLLICMSVYHMHTVPVEAKEGIRFSGI